MGLDVVLYRGNQEIEIPSKRYPNSLFKIGYFRSSYHSEGINEVLSSKSIPNLWDIFDAKDGRNKPDWKEAKQLIGECIKLSKEASLEPRYIQYLDIVEETIDFVLSQDEPQEYGLNFIT